MATNKFKISISVDEQTLAVIREHIRSGKFRNRSHVFEAAVHELSKGDKQ